MRTLRQIAISMAFLSLSGGMMAAPVNPDKAARLAVEFTSSQSGRMRIPRVTDNSLTLAYTASAQTGNAYYVFNYPDNGGFIIVSADDRLSTILGYSTEGNFDPQNVPVNMQWWLEGYTKEIGSYLATDPTVDISPLKKRAGLNFPAIDPLLTTKWNQTEPYNNMCPMDNQAHSRSVTGCVATAMAQIMNYHEWPLHPKGVSAGYNFEGTTLDWKNMIDDYENTPYNDLQANAVALLMLQCGRSVEMMYSAYASGAYSFDVPVAIREHFDYNASARMEFRDYFSYSEWMTMVYNELEAKRPVYYSGRSERGGHAFVCDGFDGTNYFHFNWGWGGYQDGWFMLTALNPEAGGTGSFAGGYNTDQSIITGWKKSEGETETQTLLISSGSFTWNGSAFVIADDPDNYNMIYNPLATVATCPYGIIIEDPATDKVVATVTETTGTVSPQYGFNTIKAKVPTTLADGTYHVYPGYNPNNKGWERIRVPNGLQKYVTIEVKNKAISYINQGAEADAYGMLFAGAPEMVSRLYGEGLKAVRYIVSNFSNSDYYGNIGFTAFSHDDPDFGDTYSATKYICIPAKSAAEVEFVIDEWSLISEGNYDFYIFDDHNNNLAEPETYHYTSNGYQDPGDRFFMNYVGPNFHVASSEGCPVTMTAVNNESYAIDADLEIILMDTDLKSTIMSRKLVQTVNIPAKTSLSLNVIPNGKELAPGSYYWIIKDQNGNILNYPSPLLVTSDKILDKESGLYYIITSEANKTARITTAPEDYTGDVVIPETVGGYKVTDIESDVFSFCRELKSVTIPSGVKYIQNSTFYDATPLTTLKINSESPILAGENAFKSEAIPTINLSMPKGTANFWAAEDFWSRFLISNWTIKVGKDVEITGGLLTDPLTNEFYTPYYVSGDEKLTINTAVPTGFVCKASWKLSDGTTGTDAGQNSVILPALKGLTGEVTLETVDGSGVESILADGETADVYTPSGLLVRSNATKAEIKALPKGLYILKGKGKVIL